MHLTMFTRKGALDSRPTALVRSQLLLNASVRRVEKAEEAERLSTLLSVQRHTSPNEVLKFVKESISLDEASATLSSFVRILINQVSGPSLPHTSKKLRQAHLINCMFTYHARRDMDLNHDRSPQSEREIPVEEE